MSKQISLARTFSTVSNTATSYQDPFNGGTITQSVEYRGSRLMAAAGVVHNLTVKIHTTPSGGDTWTYMIRKNEADTGLTFVINAGETDKQDITTGISVVAGDRISLQIIPSGSPTSTVHEWALDFDGLVAGESIYGGISGGTVATARTEGPFSTNGNIWQSTGIGGQVCPLDGTITKLYFELDQDPTVGGTSLTLAYYKEGTIQDGSGGTPDTRTTIAAGSTAANSSFSLSVTAGQLVELRISITGSPTAGRPRFGTNFIATTPGWSIFGSHPNTQLWENANTVEYWYPSGQGHSTANTTETNRTVTVGASGFTLRRLYGHISGTPGSGNSYTLTLRKNTADTLVTATIADSAVTGNDGGAVSEDFVTGDTLDMKQVSASTPSARSGNFFMVQDAEGFEPAEVPKSFAFLGTVPGPCWVD